MAELTTIEGIGDALSARLEAGGIANTDALLRLAADKRGRKTISDATGLDEKRLLRFVNHADLMRVHGVGGEYAELLEAAGVDTIPELAQRNGDNLAAKMAEVNATRRPVRALPSARRVKSWVAEARSLDRVVTH